MHDTNVPGHAMAPDRPSRFTRFLWWLSTAETSLLEHCVIDRNRYAIVGMTVLGTWTFATLAWTYFFSTVVTYGWVAVLLGLFMGGMILTIDRALIKGISAANKRKWLPLLFRSMLALVIGIFMAQPALLYLFDKEIHVQLSLDNEQRKKEKREKQDSVFYAEKKALENNRAQLQQQLTNRYTEVSAAREAFISETDGTGGSKKIGLKDIAQAKQREYQQLDAVYKQKEEEIRPQLKRIDSSLYAIQASIQKEQAAFDMLLNDGFISRIEALNHLVEHNGSVAFRYYLLVIILLLIELMPVISKTLLPEGSYERQVQLREEIEKEIITKNHQRELALKELFNQTAFEQNSRFIQSFFSLSEKERNDRLNEKLQQWKQNSTGSFQHFWEEMKQSLLTKEEH